MNQASTLDATAEVANPQQGEKVVADPIASATAYDAKVADQ